jgi:hypothetical protein
MSYLIHHEFNNSDKISTPSIFNNFLKSSEMKNFHQISLYNPLETIKIMTFQSLHPYSSRCCLLSCTFSKENIQFFTITGRENKENLVKSLDVTAEVNKLFKTLCGTIFGLRRKAKGSEKGLEINIYDKKCYLPLMFN